MNRTVKIVLNMAMGAAALILIAIVAALLTARTEWFRNYVKQKIVSETELATGGKAELGSFYFDESRLTATVTNFVIHGNEPSGSPPFVQVPLLRVSLRLFTSFRRVFDITSLAIDHPQVNVIVLANGNTNIPTPKQQSSSNESALQTVVDLAIGHFELSSGVLALDSHRQPLNVRGNNLRAQLTYNVVGRSYQGVLSLDPLYVVSGRNTPVNFRVTLPVTLHGDRIDLRNASISTPVSTISISGSMENMKKPKLAMRVRAHVATADIASAAGVPLAVSARNVPSAIDLNGDATVSNEQIEITAFHAELGRSNIEASGRLKDSAGNGSLDIRSTLSLSELGALFKVNARPEGTVVVNANAKLGQSGDYSVEGNLRAAKLAFQQGGQRIANIDLSSGLHANKQSLELTGLHVNALGGDFAGHATLVDFERFELVGDLKHLGIESALRAAGERLPYDGAISGSINAADDTKTPGMKSMTARARLSITPGKQGIPVSGRLNIEYLGATDNAGIENSWIALPHTRLDLNGSLSRTLNVKLVSGDLSDLLAAAAIKGPAPVTFNHGQASLIGTVTGSLTSPRFSGHLAANRFLVEDRPFDSFVGDVAASASGASIANAELSRASMRADLAASVGLKNWKALPRNPVAADASLVNADLADVAVLAGEPAAGYSGSLTGNAHIQGTVGNPNGALRLEAAKGFIAGQAFDSANVQVNLADQLITIPTAYVQSSHGRVDMDAEFRHSRDSFTNGALCAHLQSNGFDIAGFKIPTAKRPSLSGTLAVKASVSANVSDKVLLTGVDGDLSVHGLHVGGENYENLTATARTSAQTVSYTLTGGFAGSGIHVNGNTRLASDYPTTAKVNISNLPVEKVLLPFTDIPARGNLSGTADLNGTLSNPQGSADFNLTRAVLYSEPLDRVQLRATILPQSIDVQELQAVAGPSQIKASAHFDHPARDFERGTARFNIESSAVDLARIHNIQSLRPGLGGTVNITARGAGTIAPGAQPLLVNQLTASIAATGITAERKNLGDMKLTANTTAPGQVDFTLDSNLTGASIQSRGNARLSGTYPVSAQLTFNNVAYTKIRELIGPVAGDSLAFEALIDGKASINGPVMDTGQLRGDVQLSRLNLTTIPKKPKDKTVSIANDGPVALIIDRGNVQIQSAHLTGSGTDVQATGSTSLTTKALNLTLNAHSDLGILPSFDKDIDSSGNVSVAATVRGTTSEPLINGQLTLRNASLNYAGISNGISNANGVVAFNGNNASLQNVSAESGGGKIALTGSVAYSGPVRFGLRARGSNIRIRIQQGVSAVADANIQLSGTAQHSVISGDASIERVTYNPRTDIGSLLTRAAPPVQSPEEPSPLLENMKLDIRVRTSSSLSVQASLAQNLQADADLHIRGTAAEPGVTGRITINEGQLVFFGSTYTVSTGSIAFYNPVRIEPILDVTLETQAQSVDVTLRVTGPIDNMKLTYTSNPPLQFQEVISLLAAGKTPTTDPTVLANQPQQSQQSVQQMGESAVLGQALANPVAGRLQRVFGVTQLKLDPSFQAGSSTPTARLTLQQRITSNVTFTYTSALDDPNGEIIQVQWAFNPQWSATATRDQNGIFSVNLSYRRQFR